MGEVYKARDTRLDRTVAIKVLPAALASDPQFRERFDREARAVAALNHPHICTLYDIGHQDDTEFLVMEYLDGETLADRLARAEGLRPRRAPAALAGVGSPREVKTSSASGGGAPRAVNEVALPLDEALRYAIEIADALDKAHRAGIVHRDLKPGNIMLTKSGAKLLDFGLAKTGAPAVSGAGLSMLPTTPPNLTAQGTILGTFQYMAPEQLEGQEADARTDIFAFGAVVYEMVTGKKAFEGKSQASLIGAILEREPAPISTLQPASPPALDLVIKRCFAKDPDERWQSAGDLAVGLKWVMDAAPVIAAEPLPKLARVSKLWSAIAAVFFLTTIVLAAVLIYDSRAASESAVVRFFVSAPDKMTFEAGLGAAGTGVTAYS